jgi:hypothetical protein
MMSEKVVPSAVVQCMVKFLTNKNVKPAEILMRLRVQAGDESRTQLYDWSKSFKEGQRKAEKMQRLHLLQGKLWPVFFWTLRVSYSSIF